MRRFFFDFKKHMGLLLAVLAVLFAACGEATGTEKAASAEAVSVQETVQAAQTSVSGEGEPTEEGPEDGEYVPDAFYFRGGSGKVTITCPSVTIRDGEAHAVLVFSSSKYARAIVGGEEFAPEVGDGTTTFVVPAVLNQEMTVIGTTTAMSAPHDVEYTVFIYLAEADNGETDPGLLEAMFGAASEETAFREVNHDPLYFFCALCINRNPIRNPAPNASHPQPVLVSMLITSAAW